MENHYIDRIKEAVDKVNLSYPPQINGEAKTYLPIQEIEQALSAMEIVEVEFICLKLHYPLVVKASVISAAGTMKSSTSRSLKLANGDWSKIRNDVVYSIAHDFKLLVEVFLSDLGELDEFRLMHRDEIAEKSLNGEMTKEQFEILVKEWG